MEKDNSWEFYVNNADKYQKILEKQFELLCEKADFSKCFDAPERIEVEHMNEAEYLITMKLGYSPAGEELSDEEFYITFNPDSLQMLNEFRHNLYTVYDDFDPEEHARSWDGGRGAPSLPELVEDAEAQEKNFQELEKAFNKALILEAVNLKLIEETYLNENLKELSNKKLDEVISLKEEKYEIVDLNSSALESEHKCNLSQQVNTALSCSIVWSKEKDIRDALLESIDSTSELALVDPLGTLSLIKAAEDYYNDENPSELEELSSQGFDHEEILKRGYKELCWKNFDANFEKIKFNAVVNRIDLMDVKEKIELINSLPEDVKLKDYIKDFVKDYSTFSTNDLVSDFKKSIQVQCSKNIEQELEQSNSKSL